MFLPDEGGQEPGFNVPVGCGKSFGAVDSADFGFDFGRFADGRKEPVGGEADELAAVKLAVLLKNFQARPE